jgi:hypothetical protein
MERWSVLNILESNKKLGQRKAAALWLTSFKRLGLSARLAGGGHNSGRRQEDEDVNAATEPPFSKRRGGTAF